MATAPFDRRLTPARADLAADHLRGLVDAPRYAKDRRSGLSPQARRSGAPPTRARRWKPRRSTAKPSTVFDESGGWAWAQLDRDGYVGYLPAAALGAPASRRIGSQRCAPTPIPGPASSSRRAWRYRSARGLRSWAARAISRSRKTDCISGSRHLAETGSREPDYVAVAERFLETPYLWGGRTSEGIDCSGLVQTALVAAGVAAPRDSDMQEAALGEPIAIDDQPLARGDLVFWKGHVGVMRDPRRCCTPTAGT